MQEVMGQGAGRAYVFVFFLRKEGDGFLGGRRWGDVAG